MTTATRSCAHGYTPTVIAAWHDGALATGEMDEVRAHLPACAACQSWLAECDILDAALRAQRVPEPRAHLWNDVRLGMSKTARSRQRSPRPALRFGRVARAALAVAAVALIVLSFARVLGSRGNPQHPVAASTHTVAKPTGTPTPLPKLPPAAPPIAATPPNWQPVAVPFTATDMDALGIGLSAMDGNTGYICYAHPEPAGAQPAIYVTHDRGADWTLISHLPTQGNLDFAECDVSVDALNPSTIAAMVSEQNVDTLKSGVLFYTSTDGGATWVTRADTVALNGLATLGGRSYALWSQGADITTSTVPRLAVSADGMKTWQPIGAQFTARKLSVLQFWVRPGDGALLAEVGTFAPPGKPQTPPAMWQSTDGGSSWAQLPVPAPAPTSFTVAQPVAGQPWHICGYSYAASGSTLACSTDGGQSWVARPVLAGGSDPFAFASDGSLLVSGADSTQHLVIYRLSAGSSQWESLGREPANALLYVPAPGNGVLWAYAGGTSPGSPYTGVLGHTGAGYGIFVANYQ